MEKALTTEKLTLQKESETTQIIFFGNGHELILDFNNPKELKITKNCSVDEAGKIFINALNVYLGGYEFIKKDSK